MVESYFDMPTGARGPTMYAVPPGGTTMAPPFNASSCRPWRAPNDLFEALFATPQGHTTSVPAWRATTDPRECSASAFGRTTSQPLLPTHPGQVVHAIGSPSSIDSHSALSVDFCGKSTVGKQLRLELENSQPEISDDATNADTAATSPATSPIDGNDNWSLTSLNSGYAATTSTYGARSAPAMSATPPLGVARGSLPQGSSSSATMIAATHSSAVQHTGGYVQHHHRQQFNSSPVSSPDVDARAAAQAIGMSLEDYLRVYPAKPPLSYATLVARGILAHGPNGCTLRELYAWLERNFAYFGRSSQGPGAASWRSSVRHNLAFNPAFVRVADSKSDDAEEGGADNPSKDAASRSSKRARWLMSPEYMRCLTPEGTFRRAKRSKKSPVGQPSSPTAAVSSPKATTKSSTSTPSPSGSSATNKGVKRSASVPLDSSSATKSPLKKLVSGFTAPPKSRILAGTVSSASLATLLRERLSDASSSDLLSTTNNNSTTSTSETAMSTTDAGKAPLAKTEDNELQQQLDLITMLGLDDLADLVVDTTAMASQPRVMVGTSLSSPPPSMFARAVTDTTMFNGLSAATSVDEHFNMALACRRSPMLCSDLDPQASADISDLARWLLD